MCELLTHYLILCMLSVANCWEIGRQSWKNHVVSRLVSCNTLFWYSEYNLQINKGYEAHQKWMSPEIQKSRGKMKITSTSKKWKGRCIPPQGYNLQRTEKLVFLHQRRNAMYAFQHQNVKKPLWFCYIAKDKEQSSRLESVNSCGDISSICFSCGHLLLFLPVSFLLCLPFDISLRSINYVLGAHSSKCFTLIISQTARNNSVM